MPVLHVGQGIYTPPLPDPCIQDVVEGYDPDGRKWHRPEQLDKPNVIAMHSHMMSYVQAPLPADSLGVFCDGAGIHQCQLLVVAALLLASRSGYNDRVCLMLGWLGNLTCCKRRSAQSKVLACSALPFPGDCLWRSIGRRDGLGQGAGDKSCNYSNSPSARAYA